MKSFSLQHRNFWTAFTCVLFSLSPLQSKSFAKKETKTNFDVVVLMATPGGIAAAVSAARLGAKVALIERTNHLGGLPANGLGATDIHKRELSGGFFKEFTDSIFQFYIKKYGDTSKQVKDCSNGFHFEPTVAEEVLKVILSKEENIKVFLNYQFDSDKANVEEVSEKGTKRILVFQRNKPRKTLWIEGKVWIDGSYEGDLAAAFGCRFRTYREGKTEFGEPMA